MNLYNANAFTHISSSVFFLLLCHTSAAQGAHRDIRAVAQDIEEEKKTAV